MSFGQPPGQAFEEIGMKKYKAARAFHYYLPTGTKRELYPGEDASVIDEKQLAGYVRDGWVTVEGADEPKTEDKPKPPTSAGKPKKSEG